MRNYLARLLRTLAEWLSPTPQPVPLVDPALLALAQLAVANASTAYHSSSFKRLIALKQLRASCPAEKDRVLNLAIELALLT